MDIYTVITLGKLVKQPLIGSPSELTDGSEPHGCIEVPRCSGAGVQHGVVGEGVYPGWASRVGTGRVLYRVLS